jgi:hypothetical protein
MQVFTIINHAGKIKVYEKSMGQKECEKELRQEMAPGVCSIGPPFQWINLSKEQITEVFQKVQTL